MLATLGVCSALPAQSQAPVPLRAEARLVILDAVVTDKNGASVHGLAAKDFHIFEDGKEQIVVSATDRLERSGLVETYLEVYAPLLKERNPVQLGLHVGLLDGASGERKWDSGNVDLSGLAQAGNAVIPVALRLPVAGLAPGAYRAEFTVEDSAGGRAVRDVEFRLE